MGGSPSAVHIDEYVPYVPAWNTSITIITWYSTSINVPRTDRSEWKNRATRKEARGWQGSLRSDSEASTTQTSAEGSGSSVQGWSAQGSGSGPGSSAEGSS